MFLKCIRLFYSVYKVCFEEPMNVSERNGVHVEEAAHCERFVIHSLRYNYILRIEHAPFRFQCHHQERTS